MAPKDCMRWRILHKLGQGGAGICENGTQSPARRVISERARAALGLPEVS